VEVHAPHVLANGLSEECFSRFVMG
jgi:hypothetical protein